MKRESEMNPGRKLEIIRAQKLLSQEELASCAGLSLSTYSDLEGMGDLQDNISLRNLRKLCKCLQIRPIELFTEAENDFRQSIGFEEIQKTVKEYLSVHNLELSRFENQVGWELAEFVNNPDAAWKWNVEELRNVCDAVAIDWLSALPT